MKVPPVHIEQLAEMSCGACDINGLLRQRREELQETLTFEPRRIGRPRDITQLRLNDDWSQELPKNIRGYSEENCLEGVRDHDL